MSLVLLTVLLQPMKEEPPMSAKCKDKFLVQSTIITPERETVSLTDIWSMIEKEDKSQIYEQKIKCAFLPPASAPVPEENEDAVGGSAISEDVSGRRLARSFACAAISNVTLTCPLAAISDCSGRT